jgi:hypothetical protein
MTKTLIALSIISLVLLATFAQTSAEPRGGLDPGAYLPVVMGPPFECPTSSTRSYASGPAFQYDTENPVRPAYNHAGKNIELRGYIPNTDPGLQRELVNYGSNDPTQPPQFATLFSPYQVPPLSEFFRVFQWNWAPSPDPGTPGSPNMHYPATALSFALPPGATLRTPLSGYDIGGGMEVIVLYADEDTIALHYTREDTYALGYTIYLNNICTDPNLLNLYNSLDNPNGPRYDYPSAVYNLPSLPAGKIFGTTSGADIVLAAVDSGSFQDPRSCNDWWQIRPGYPGSCPPALFPEGLVNFIVN